MVAALADGLVRLVQRELVGAVRRREQRYANSTVAQAQAGKRAWLTVLRVCQLQLLFIFTFTC